MIKVFRQAAFAVICATLNLGALAGEKVEAATFQQIINLNSVTNTDKNPISLSLAAGKYQIEYLNTSNGGIYDAWNLWNFRTKGCNALGTNCEYGWSNYYSIRYGKSDTLYSDGYLYSTALQAQKNAVNASFTLSADEKVDFYLPDSFYDDNKGGVSLKITADSTHIPEPNSILALIGIAGIGYLTKRRLPNTED